MLLLEVTMYDKLKQFIETEEIQEIFLQIEQDIMAGVKLSPEAASDAHYEYRAFQRFLGRLQQLQSEAYLKQKDLEETREFE